MTVVTLAAGQLIQAMSTMAELLADSPILAALPPAVLQRLASRAVTRSVDAGFTLFRVGDISHGIYFVVEGRVRIFRTAPDGREQTIALEGEGRAIAELPMYDGGPYPASATTTQASRLLYLPRSEFEHAFQSDPEVAAAVVRALGARMRHLVQVIETIAFRDVAARLAMHLADLAERGGAISAAGTIAITLDRTQEALATELGTARESVSRALKQLEQVGMIHERHGQQLNVALPGQLRDWARNGPR